MRSLFVILTLLTAVAAGAYSEAPEPSPPAPLAPAVRCSPPPPAETLSPASQAPAPAAVAVRSEPVPPVRSEGRDEWCGVRGVVLDEHGVPIEEFEVVRDRTRYCPPMRGVNRGRGEFDFPCGPDGPFYGPVRFDYAMFTVRAPGRAPVEMHPTEEEIEVLRRGGVLGGVEITLRREAVISGRVLRPDGTPAPHAVVRLASATDLRESTWGHFELADTDGRFEIDEVDPTAELSLLARDGEELISDAVPLAEVLGGADRATVEVLLRRRLAVTLEVATAGLPEETTLVLDGVPRPFAEPVVRIETRTGAHLLRVIGEEDELAAVRFEIPEGLAIHVLDLTAPAAEETARADRPR